MSDDPGTDRAPELDRQLAIWTGLYGPMRAGELVAELRDRLADEPDRPVAELAAELDPDDEDWEEGGLARPGVG